MSHPWEIKPGTLAIWARPQIPVGTEHCYPAGEFQVVVKNLIPPGEAYVFLEGEGTFVARLSDLRRPHGQ